MLQNIVQSASRVLGAGALVLMSMTSTADAESVRGMVVLVPADQRGGARVDQAGTVVWLEPSGPVTRTAAAAPRAVTMRQRNMTFVPHILVVEVGTTVDFPNNDPIFHNVFSNFDGQVFDLQLYAPQTARRVIFRRPGIVHIFCNIHEFMSAAIAVVPTPYFAVTGATGQFEIDAPAGAYRVRYWHERAPPEGLASLERAVTVNAAVSLPETRIVVSTDPPMPHLDKYGHEYAHRPDDRVLYQGTRR